jgi:uncharacterized DUF497 family protein
MCEWDARGVTFGEAATVFDDPQGLDGPDLAHSERERRYRRLGRTASGRLLIVGYFSDLPETSDKQLRAMRRVGRPPLGRAARHLIAIRIDPTCSVRCSGRPSGGAWAISPSSMSYSRSTSRESVAPEALTPRAETAGSFFQELPAHGSRAPTHPGPADPCAGRAASPCRTVRIPRALPARAPA